MKNKRERLERAMADEPVDRVPVALWRPFPGDDQRIADFATCVINFQKQYDWDFVNIYPATNYAVIDYGLQDVWNGAPDGTRDGLHYPIKRSVDWTKLRMLDPSRGELAKQVMTVKMIDEGLRDTPVPIIVTVYSPLAQARRMTDEGLFVRNLRKHPARVSTGLNIITESTLLFLDALKPLNISGIYYIIEHADYDHLSEREYIDLGLIHDQKILESLPSHWWFNMIYLRGSSPMFDITDKLPPFALNWHDRTASPTLADSRVKLRSAACGGVDAEEDMRAATPSIIRDAARNALLDMRERRIILGAGGPILATTPLSNIRALREAVEKVNI